MKKSHDITKNNVKKKEKLFATYILLVMKIEVSDIFFFVLIKKMIKSCKREKLISTCHFCKLYSKPVIVH